MARREVLISIARQLYRTVVGWIGRGTSNRQQAEYSSLASEKWMQENASHLVHSLHNHVGELPFLAFTDQLTAYSSVAPAPSAG